MVGDCVQLVRGVRPGAVAGGVERSAVEVVGCVLSSAKVVKSFSWIRVSIFEILLRPPRDRGKREYGRQECAASLATLRVRYKMRLLSD